MAACEETFQGVKFLLSSPPILMTPKENASLFLYLVVYEKAMSSIVVWEGEEGERSVYFGSKVLKGTKL